MDGRKQQGKGGRSTRKYRFCSSGYRMVAVTIPGCLRRGLCGGDPATAGQSPRRHSRHCFRYRGPDPRQGAHFASDIGSPGY